uniref:Huntingtin n=1 Tax=Timema cristinae TaxID=61476 RepID=A0A7R9CEN3_TIMCR|nr:unnamed protein product [Timema cristinae]
MFDPWVFLYIFDQLFSFQNIFSQRCQKCYIKGRGGRIHVVYPFLFSEAYSQEKMATLEKLIKSLENLKLLQLSPQISDESSARKKEKVALCVSIADVMCSSGVKGTPNFSHLLSITMEMFLQLCNDPHSDVRMIADESLNRIIRAMLDNNVVKIQVELHKEIKKNGSARTLRAALWRFAELCHMIRPQKGKPYVLNLIPCILHIAQRTEEPVLETLAVAMPKIFAALGNFTSDNDVKSLLKVFLVNLSSPAAVVRRTAATSILAVCVHCRKPHVFIAYILNTLLDCVVPIRDTQPVWTVLGVLGCLRHLLPHFGTTKPGEEELKGSFGVRKRHQEAPQAVDRLIQVYELCLHYTNHPDHNVVNAALETLHQLLQAPPGALVPVLLSPQGITRSRVHATDGGDQLSRRSLSQMSVAPSLAPGDIGSLLDPETDPDLTSVERWVNESKPGVIFSSSLSLLPPVVPERVGAGPLEGPGDEDEDESCMSQVDEGPQYSNIRIGQIREQEESLLDSPGRPLLSSVQSFQQSEDTKLSPDDEQTTYSVPLSPTFTQTSVPFSACDVGSFTDADVSLKFCSRHLAAMFLLTGCPGHTMPDRNIRVSVKALALSCLASILRLTPDVFLLPLDKNKTPNTEGVQLLSDTLLYSQHSDPQLRALVSTLISSVLKSALIQSGRDLSRWLGDTNLVLLGNFLELLLKGLKDESSVCCGQTLAAVGACLPDLLECVDNRQWLPILGALLDMVANPYWLVKVKLAGVVGEMPFVTIHHLVGSPDYQEKILHSVLLVLLRDENARVRHAAAEAFVKTVPYLFYPVDHGGQDPVTAKAALYSRVYLSPLIVGCLQGHPSSLPQRPNIISLPAPFNVGLTGTYVASLDAALSRVVNLLSQQLLMSQSRHLVFGCCETLTLLSVEYLTTVYPQAWNCQLAPRKNSQSARVPVSASAGLLATTLSLLTSSPVSVDLSCQQWLLHLAGNMFSGLAVNSLRTVEILSPHLSSGPPQRALGHVPRQTAECVVRASPGTRPETPQYICACPRRCPSYPSLHQDTRSPLTLAHQEERTDGHYGNSRNVAGQDWLGAVTFLGQNEGQLVCLSTDKEDKMEEKKSGRGVPLGLFANLPHYVKIHDMVKSAYTNYKITLDCGASEKFISLLRTTLEALSQLLEIASLHEAGRVAEEILAYMRLTISIEPTSTVKCVQQLRCLSPAAQESVWYQPERSVGGGAGEEAPCGAELSWWFLQHLLTSPVQNISPTMSARPIARWTIFPREYTGQFSAVVTCGLLSRGGGREGEEEPQELSCYSWLNYFYNKGERKASTVFKSVNRGADKTALASYIRLFEPMVIKALKQYTVTSDVQLQCRVLLLLIQLVQLRVNYCLLDSDQIFIGFVLKQFEFIEEGQIPQPEELVPRIFYFLVHLSYEKHHSKCIIGVPKVIQLCDELMASGQPPVSHCIQALVPVVEDVFLVRGTTGSTADLKDLDTQREFLVSMLLRLVEYHQVLELLGLVLSESRQGCDWEERWRRWSRQVMDTLLPLLAKGRVRLESRVAQLALHRLLAAASPCVLRPVDPLLKVLLSDPLHLHSSLVGVQRWLGMVLAVLSVLVAQGKEEVVLARLEELGLSVPSPEIIYQKESRDPLNATQSSARLPPDQVLARMLLRVLGVVSSELHTCVLNPVSSEDWNYLHEQFSVFLLYCIHMFQSGSSMQQQPGTGGTQATTSRDWSDPCDNILELGGHRVANATMLMIQSEGPESLPMADVNTLFLELSTRCPLITFLWCYLLTLLNYSNQGFWAQVLRTQPHQLLLNQRYSTVHYQGILVQACQTCSPISDLMMSQ